MSQLEPSDYKAPTADAKSSIPMIEFPNWRSFHDYIINAVLSDKHLIYRGQSRDWPLLSSFDRRLSDTKRTDAQQRNRLLATHLANFQRSSVGRRGLSPHTLDDNEWWALGQHWGLATPLLDWTFSPFIASYFAFEIDSDEKLEPYRFVYAMEATTIQTYTSLIRRIEAHSKWQHEEIVRLQRENVDLRTKVATLVGETDFKDGDTESHELATPYPKLTFVRPTTDENYRLVNQRAIFVKSEDGLSIEEWATKCGITLESAQLTKFKVFAGDRVGFLKVLNSMNINRSSLFPDLHGSAYFCNLALESKDYFDSRAIQNAASAGHEIAEQILKERDPDHWHLSSEQQDSSL